MSDVYKELAKKLDELPQGFPPTESGIELKILKKIYRPEDAEVAMQLMAWGETAEKIAERFEKSTDEMRAILDDMAKRGQIASFTARGKQRYLLAPFLPGIYEFQVYRLDRDLVEMFEEYLPTLAKRVGGYKPGVARTVPINAQIEPGKQIQRYEDVRKMIEDSVSFRIIECICRKERDIEGHPCDHTLENCLSFSKEENAYDYFTIGGKTISKQEALEVLEGAAEEGLVHSAFYNIKHGQGSICNCCSCCCGVLRGVKEFEAPHMIAMSDFVAVIDQDECVECGVCADERCPMEAITEEDSGYVVQSERCIGCGVCTVTCPTEAISLVRKPESEQEAPPDTMKDWAMERTANRTKAVESPKE
jgi:Pyruvate/2-oxoacid:ferredoxin oxidoreductase delta subunit